METQRFARFVPHLTLLLAIAFVLSPVLVGHALAVTQTTPTSVLTRGALIVGIPFEDKGNLQNAGAVSVLYSWFLTGVIADGSQWFDLNTPGMPGIPKAGDEFGHALAVGDFDGDGYMDLAVGIPGDDRGTVLNSGSVTVLYGGHAGFSTAGVQWFDQGTPGIAGSPEQNDKFGKVLATGDFNGDGFADLAVGVPTEDTTAADAGGVEVLYGSSSGLTPQGSQWIDQNAPTIPGSAGDSYWFGNALAAGDFDKDGYADLAIGIPGETVGTAKYAGGVVILYGSSWGLVLSRSQHFDQDTPGMPGHAEKGDRFGSTLTTGDFNGDGYMDLAIGVPSEDKGAIISAGMVHVLYGGPSGLRVTNNQWFDQAMSELPGFATRYDFFGNALTAGDFNRDGYSDLVIGVPGETVSSASRAGGVCIIYGASTGLQVNHNQWFDQDTPGIPDRAEERDLFGNALAAGDLNGDGYADLAIGVPSEDTTTVQDAGGVHVLYGTPQGLTTWRTRYFDQNTPGFSGSKSETEDAFGWALAIAPVRTHYLQQVPYVLKKQD